MEPIKDEEIHVFSATECTGLIPSLPDDEEEKESYKEISHPLPERHSKPQR